MQEPLVGYHRKSHRRTPLGLARSLVPRILADAVPFLRGPHRPDDRILHSTERERKLAAKLQRESANGQGHRYFFAMYACRKPIALTLAATCTTRSVREQREAAL